MVYCIFKVKGCYDIVRNRTQTSFTKATTLFSSTPDYFSNSVLRITSKACIHGKIISTLVCKSKVCLTNKVLQKHKGYGVIETFLQTFTLFLHKKRKLLIVVKSYSK